MTLDPVVSLRLAFLIRVVARESDHLALTEHRLFAVPFDVARAERLSAEPDLAERVEAFVPSLLSAVGAIREEAARRGWLLADGPRVASR